MALADKIKPSAPKYSMEQLIAELLQSTVEIHKAHFATKSYAQHKAFEDYYSSIEDLVDTLTETWQGAKGLITIPKAKIEMIEPKGYLMSILLYSNKVYPEISIGAIKNTLDEIEGLIYQTLYKLNNLA
jgi:hypothetical protein